MTPDDWAEYRRWLELREQRRRDIQAAFEWFPTAGRGWWWDTERGER